MLPNRGSKGLGGRTLLSLAVTVLTVVLCTGEQACAQFRSRSALGSYDPKVNPAGGALGAVGAAVAGGIGAAVSTAGTAAAFSSSQKLVVEDEDGFPVVRDNQGALYTEPAWSLGEGKTSVGLGYTYLNFDRFDGKSLGSLFDGNLDSDFKLDAHVWVLSYGKGITEQLDVFVLVPLLSLEGSGGFYLAGEPFGNSVFDEADTGLGDVVLRTKYEIMNDGDSAFSVGGDLVFPTGDEDLYLGGGGMGYRVRALYGKKFDKFYPTAEIAYFWSGIRGDSRLILDESDFNQFEYRLGIPYEVSERATVALEWIGSKSDAFTQNDLGVSGRWDMGKFKEGLVIDLGVRVPVDDDGLRTSFTPTVAVEYRF